jgi:hypothetical protein
MKKLQIKWSGYDVALNEFITNKTKAMLICHDDQDMKELIIQRLRDDLKGRFLFISPKTENQINKLRKYIVVHEPTHLDDGSYTDAQGRRMHASSMMECFIHDPVIIFDNLESMTYDFMEKLPSKLHHYGVYLREPLDETSFIFLLDKVKFQENKVAGISPGGVDSITFGYLNPTKVDFGLDTEPFVSRFDNASGKAQS